MAFSLGAVAGGVGETLDRLLAERRAEALARQQAEAQQAERAFRDRQLAQQLQIEQMRDARDRAAAQATAAGKRLADIRTNYTNIGKQVVERFGPGDLVPRDVAAPVMGAYDVLTEAGDMPLAPPITESAIPVQRFVTPMTTGAIAPTPTPGEAVAGGTAMAPMPRPAQAELPTVPLTRVSAGVMAEPMFTRTPTAEETELQEASAITDPIDMSAPIPRRLQQIGAAKQRLVGLRPRVASNVRQTLNALETTTRAEAALAAQAAAIEKQTQNRGSLSATSEANLMVKLSKDWDTARQPIEELSRQVSLMDAGLAAARRGDMAQGAQAVLVTFQKILDPPSVVRESEYMRSAAGLALKDRLKGYIERLVEGGAGVPLDQLEKFAQLAREAAKAQTSGYLDKRKKRLTAQAEKYGIAPYLIFGDDDEDGLGGGAVTAGNKDGLGGGAVTAGNNPFK